MEIKDIRRNRLLELIQEFGTAKALADTVGVDETYLVNIKNRVKTRAGTGRGMGDRIARRIEEKLGKPLGWMDRAMLDDEAALLDDYRRSDPAEKEKLRNYARAAAQMRPAYEFTADQPPSGSRQESPTAREQRRTQSKRK